MNRLIYILVFVALTAFISHEPYVIGLGHIGPFWVKKTTVKQIISKFGAPNLFHCYATTGSGEVSHIEMAYKSKGIAFYYYNAHYTFKGNKKRYGFTIYDDIFKNEKRDKFDAIELTKNCEAQTDKGISIKSTREDIYKAYGSPEYKGDTIQYLDYGGLGMRFKFNERKIANPHDTVIQILIFEPPV